MVIVTGDTVKTIGFFVRNIDVTKPPFLRSEVGYNDFGFANQQYLLALNRADVKAYFVTDNASYLGGGRFANAWTIHEARAVPEFREVGPITASVVYEKGGFEGRDVLTVTDPKLREICNKAETYRRFGQFQPKTVIVANPQELKAAIADMPGEMVVVKNPAGSSGQQVYIAAKDELVVPETETYPMLVQEFVDMSDGLPGLAAGPHDVRVIMAGNTILGGTLRQPAAGRLLANTGQGGSLRLLSRAELPKAVVDMAHSIDGELKEFPRYYSLDFAKGTQGWKLIELNGKPGLYYRDVGPLAQEFMDGFVSYMVGLA
ncbi:MAG TPA: hypothetical protein VMT30_07800 [Candidatus Saccharimonadia bacterium]|nr:hypothetical protein [Candidatus Saccharimonadia bacterium]